MGLRTMLGSKRTRTLSALTMLAQAGLAYRRGQTRAAALYALAAPLAYRNTALGVGAQVLARLYRRQRATA